MSFKCHCRKVTVTKGIIISLCLTGGELTTFELYTIQICSNNLIPSLNEKEVNLMVHEKRQCHCSRVFILVLGPVCGRITVFWNPDKKKN